MKKPTKTLTVVIISSDGSHFSFNASELEIDYGTMGVPFERNPRPMRIKATASDSLISVHTHRSLVLELVRKLLGYKKRAH